MSMGSNVEHNNDDDDFVIGGHTETVKQMRALLNPMCPIGMVDDLADEIVHRIAVKSGPVKPDDLHDILIEMNVKPGYRKSPQEQSAPDTRTRTNVSVDEPLLPRFVRSSPAFHAIVTQQFPEAFQGQAFEMPERPGSVKSLNLSDLSSADMTSIRLLHRRPPRKFRE
uniref:Uncharacterized protein n=1 Tax=Spongospora subterranea TaxID=70186 RepID=A0A0H5R1G5_9EUKA|eukprot:CRZ01654.1 hypothetical protein [Spongospora subterranea]